jgi:glycosyltransferase involved in cell wall biosynthesis
MRIAVFHNLPSGGGKRSLFEWVSRMVNVHSVDVYSLSTADHAFCDIRPLVQKHRVYDFIPRRLFNSPLGRLNQLQRWRDLTHLDRLNRRIAEQINAGNYDVVFANTCLFTFIPPLLQYLIIPAAYYLHEPFGRGFIRQIERPYLTKNDWQKWLDRYDLMIRLYQNRLDVLQERSVHKTKRLLANSQFTLDSIRATYGVDVALCRYGVEVDSFRPLSGISRGNFVVSVGELSPRKGFDFIVESLGHISPERRPSLKLACNTIISEEREYVERLAGQYGVNLQILTRLGTDELRLLYNQARICIYAPVQEPFGLVPLEAMACGTPVIGVREGGVQESVIHEFTGLLVERDPHLFAAAIQRLLADSGLAETYGLNGREHVSRNWTWDQSAANLVAHLADCAALIA